MEIKEFFFLLPSQDKFRNKCAICYAISSKLTSETITENYIFSIEYHMNRFKRWNISNYFSFLKCWFVVFYSFYRYANATYILYAIWCYTFQSIQMKIPSARLYYSFSFIYLNLTQRSFCWALFGFLASFPLLVQLLLCNLGEKFRSWITHINEIFIL